MLLTTGQTMQHRLFHRRLAAQTQMGLRCLDAVTSTTAAGLVIRAFFARGTDPASFASQSGPGAATITDLRDISGGILVAGLQPAGGPARLTMRPGSEAAFLELTTGPAEPELFAGKNVAMLVRMEEPAERLRDWLAYHCAEHGVQAVLVLNREPASRLADELPALLRSLPDAPGGPLTVVVLDSPVPLGLPDTGAQSLPFLAPDAPGKDRMAQPEPDPWRAPLGEMLLFEIAKWRFLGQARAVLSLDLPDILAPRPDLPSFFDLATRARRGVVLLEGRRIYPWRVRAGQAPVFGDHICRPFDLATPIPRWCVAPEVAGLDAAWRPGRVSFTKAETADHVSFFRCMGLRHPGHGTAELVPKSSLIEDPSLLAMAQEVFHHDPVRAPKSVPRSGPGPRQGRTAIVTTMKNEGPFILEWLAYHRAIGVDDFLIYTNDCTDGTDSMLDLLQAKGLVQHRDNPFKSTVLKPQHAALQAAEAEPVIRNSAWAICMDVDEFINIKIGDGTLRALYDAIGDANMISLTWRLFGNDDVARFEDRFITRQFTACAPELTRKPHQAWGFKTLFRNIGIYRKLGVHRPKGLLPDLWDQIHWLNGSGKPMPKEMLRNGWRSTTTTYGYDMVALNHYAVRSAESFLVKRDRGRVNHVDRDQGLNYWFRMNFNADRDGSIQRMIPALQAEYDRLLADPEISYAHEACVAAHRARIADLRQAAQNIAFFDDLTSPRLQALCRLQAHFGSAVFAAGPEVIPPDLHLQPLPPEFFFTVASQTKADP